MIVPNHSQGLPNNIANSILRALGIFNSSILGTIVVVKFSENGHEKLSNHDIEKFFSLFRDILLSPQNMWTRPRLRRTFHIVSLSSIMDNI